MRARNPIEIEAYTVRIHLVYSRDLRQSSEYHGNRRASVKLTLEESSLKITLKCASRDLV